METFWHLTVTGLAWFAVYFVVVAVAAGLWIGVGMARQARQARRALDAEIEALLTGPLAAEVARAFAARAAEASQEQHIEADDLS